MFRNVDRQNLEAEIKIKNQKTRELNKKHVRVGDARVLPFHLRAYSLLLLDVYCIGAIVGCFRRHNHQTRSSFFRIKY